MAVPIYHYGFPRQVANTSMYPLFNPAVGSYPQSPYDLGAQPHQYPQNYNQHMFKVIGIFYSFFICFLGAHLHHTYILYVSDFNYNKFPLQHQNKLINKPHQSSRNDDNNNYAKTSEKLIHSQGNYINFLMCTPVYT